MRHEFFMRMNRDLRIVEMNQAYLDTARLLTQVAPIVMESGVFALKGGTAINLFIRDMPRLSVDLDLVFPDYRLPRDLALARINEAILQSAARLKTRGFRTRTVTATGTLVMSNALNGPPPPCAASQ